MKAHDAIIRLLAAADVEQVFALMSEDTMTMMSKLEERWADRIQLVKTRHEQGALAMADGYARAGDRMGVCLLGRGPAVSQTGNAMVTARKTGSDVLVIVPETSLSAEYDIKAFDQEAYLRATIGTVVSIRSHDRLVDGFRDAMRRVAVGEGPLAVQIPWDLLDGEMASSGEVDVDQLDRFPAVDGGQARTQPDADLVNQSIDILEESDAFQPPVVLAGRGAMASNARHAIEDFAQRTSALLTSSLQARNFFADHPFYLGFTGSWGTNVANKYASEAHVVYAIGASLNPYTIDDGHVFGEHTQVVHIDADPAQLGRYADITLGIEGDARATVEALNAELARRGIDREGELWSDDLGEEIRSASPMNERSYPDVPGTMDPRELVVALNEYLPEEKHVVVDGGHFTRWCLDGIHTPPEAFTFSLDFASIGLGLPMGVGTALATDRHCVTICGDAGLMMSIQELETAVRHDVPLTVIVMNDESLGSEYHSLEVLGESPDVALVSAPEFAEVAEALGAEGVTVRSMDELAAIEDRLGSEPDGPFVVDCKVNHLVRHRSKR